MDLISCRDAFDFLAKSAPRPWLRRMLSWMIVTGELLTYFEEGRSIEGVRAVSLIWGVVTAEMSETERNAAIREQFDAALAERLIQAAPNDTIKWVSRTLPKLCCKGL